VLLLSPFLLPGQFYEISETGQYAKSAAGELSQAGFDVWLVDERRTHLAPMSCESGTDCSAMAGWNFAAYSEDALFALSLLKSFNPREKPVVGGFSAGSNAALATVNRAPQEFRGLVPVRGHLLHRRPGDRGSQRQPVQHAGKRHRRRGVVRYEHASLGRGTAAGSGQPCGLSPLPFFPPGTTNEQSMLFVFGSPPPAGALSPTPNFVRSIVDFGAQRFVFSNEERLKLTGPLFDNYASLAALRDLACGLAGRDDSYYRNLGQFQGDLLVFVEGTGFGQAMFDTVSLFDHARNVNIDSHPELGESDPYFGFRWQQTFLKPLQQWLKRTL